MMILSVVCQAEDGTVVDLRVDQPLIQTQPLGPTLFGAPGSSSSSSPTTTTKSFSSTATTTTTDSSSNKDEKQRKPYCDEISPDEYRSYGVCYDRQDDSNEPGLFPCGNGVNKKDYRDCDGGLYGDNDDEIEYIEDTDTEDIGDELGNIMKDDDNDDSANNKDADELVENIGDDLGDVMKD